MHLRKRVHFPCHHNKKQGATFTAKEVAPCFYITFLYYSLDFSENLLF